jgi:hypothetical protein
MRPSVPFRLVKSSPSPHRPQTALRTLSSSCPESQSARWSSPNRSENETLGNKLQRLAILSPRSVVGVEMLVDHLLKSVSGGGRGLLAASLISGAIIRTLLIV